MTTSSGAPIFDADQHMYETADALTKYLPEQYRRAVQYAPVRQADPHRDQQPGHRLHPEPDVRAGRRPGRPREFFAGENTEGLTLREMQGQAIEAPAATRNPADRVAELDRQGVIEALNYPTLASLVEHSAADDPN